MITIESSNRRRRRERLGLTGSGMALAAGFLAYGVALLSLPQISSDLAAGGFDPRIRYVLGFAHLAGGLALLIPRLASKVALPLGLLMVGVSIWIPPRIDLLQSCAPIFMAAGVLLLAGSWRLRIQADRDLWIHKLTHYADLQDAGPVANT
ncbi:hypothetical protein P12x_001991 [Tundrisphaera lichenicola]|uniref:hypothetical protein n=1 Tax=Tundrisphaera lichenicola TaxID=2029860 RepID=UPI003EBB6429